MKILPDRLTSTPQEFRFRADSAWWQVAMPPERGLPRELGEPLAIAVAAHRMGDDLYLEGGVEGALELECSRCLARYRHPLRETFRLVLEPAGDRSPAEPEAAEALSRHGVCLGDELETGWYRGRELDLGTFLREVVALALPVQPLCRESCPGLCSRCGAELGAGPCGCPQTPSDSPFAVLATLRGAKGGDD